MAGHGMQEIGPFFLGVTLGPASAGTRSDSGGVWLGETHPKAGIFNQVRGEKPSATVLLRC